MDESQAPEPCESNLADALERVASEMFTNAADKQNPQWQETPGEPTEPSEPLCCEDCGTQFTAFPEMRISTVLRCVACWQKLDALRTAAEKKGFRLGI